MRVDAASLGRRSKAAPARFTSLLRAALGLMLISGSAAAAVVSMASASAATTTSTSTGNPFPLALNSDSYTGNATLVVTGSDVNSSEISISIYTPRNLLVTTQNFAVTGTGTFNASIQAGGPSWNVTGLYSLSALWDIPDYTGVPPTSYATFHYTAVALSTTSQTTSSTQVSTTNPGPGITLLSVLPVLVVVVLAIGIVGYLLSSRGRRPMRGGGSGQAPKNPTSGKPS
ncbi:MAG TPA: hypothetical protein VLY65_02600 [Nitrososphaerales archaeon]|nr:hypothetical protein [Nitrososphaerales archaeon]